MSKNTLSELEKNQSKNITSDMIFLKAQPLTENIKGILDSFDAGKSIVATGCAGTGKTFNFLNKAIQEVIKPDSDKKIVIFRNIVPLRNIGHLPGTKEEKEAEFEAPYIQIVNDTFGTKGTFMYEKMKEKGLLEFHTTSHNQGITIDNAFIIVDEAQNFNYLELYNAITRSGRNTRILIAGDFRKQNALKNSKNDKSGLVEIMNIIKRHTPLLEKFDFYDMKTEDIIRGGDDGLCKLFIEADFEYYDGEE